MLASLVRSRILQLQRFSVGTGLFLTVLLVLVLHSQDPVKVVVYSSYRGMAIVSLYTDPIWDDG